MLMPRTTRWRPDTRRRVGPAITPTARDPRLLAGAVAALVLVCASFAAGLLVAGRFRR